MRCVRTSNGLRVLMLRLPRVPGSKQHERRKRARAGEGNEEDPFGGECPICMEPQHPHLLAGCLHRRHADPTLDCCECNTYKGPDDPHDISSAEVRAERPHKQAALAKAHKALAFQK